MSTAITAGARRALAAAVCDGHRLTIPGRLAPRAYAEVKRVLEAAGGPWSTREQAHIFPGDAAETLAGILAGGRVTSDREAHQWYPTPPDVAEEMLCLAHIQPGLEVLEPSAGLGAIAGPLVAAGCAVDCVEMHEGRAETLRALGARNVWAADFLTMAPGTEYDRVLMNPPFKGGADVGHVLHALQYVKPGGQLVAIMSAGVTHNGTRAPAKVRELASKGGRIEPLPRDTFKHAGASPATVLVVIPVPDDRPLPEGGEPVRVTFDRTAAGVPLFVPSAARPGRYVHDGWRGHDQVFAFAGWCVGCGARTWQHESGGGDDIRGPFGWNTCVPIDCYDLAGEAAEIPEDVSFPRCAECYNERGYEGHRKAINAAVTKLRAMAKPAPVAPAVIPAPPRQARELVTVSAQNGLW